MRVTAVTSGSLDRALTRENAPRVPLAGDTLRTAFDEVAGDDLMVRTDDGLILRLAGLAQQARKLSPGDVLMLRVLATEPQLELELFGTYGPRQRESGGGDGTPAAFRLDQAVMRQVSMQLPEPAELAARWRRQVLSGSALALQGQAGVMAALPGTDAVLEGPGAVSDRGFYPVYAWGGVPALISAVPSPSDDKRAPHRPRAMTQGLRLDMVLPGLGRVSIKLYGSAAGIQLEIEVDRAETVPVIREAMPAIAAALARSELPLQRVGISQGRASGVVLAGPAEGAASLSPVLFRAVAEVAVALLSTTLAGHINPASR